MTARNPYANEWCFPKAAKHISHGRILPMPDPRPSLFSRLFGRNAASKTRDKAPSGANQ